MSTILPINIEALLHCRIVESERVEFKASWDPDTTGPQVLRTICAFANDYHNLNGGYVVIGVAEREGRSFLPPAGLSAEEIEAAQRWIRGHCNRLDPPPPSCRPNRSAAGSSWWCGRRRAKFCVTPRKSDPYADSRHRSAWLPPCAAARLVAANSYASRAPILHRDLLPWLMLLLRNTAWDPDMVVVPSFETHAPLTPTLRIERLTDEPVHSPPCRG